MSDRAQSIDEKTARSDFDRTAYLDRPGDASNKQGTDGDKGNRLAREGMFHEEDGTFVTGEDVEIGLIDRLGVHCAHINQIVVHVQEQEIPTDRYSTAPGRPSPFPRRSHR